MRRPFVSNFGDEIEAIKEVDVLTGEIKQRWNTCQSSQQRTLWQMKTKFHGPLATIKEELAGTTEKNYGTTISYSKRNA